MEKKNDFKPFISADKVLPEFTVTSHLAFQEILKQL